MKNLKLLVDGSVIKFTPTCNFKGLFPGMTEPLQLDFDFSPEWESGAKVAAFWSMSGKEYSPQILKGGKSCKVPVEALQRDAFKVQILGSMNGERTSTTKCTIYLEGGRT